MQLAVMWNLAVMCKLTAICPLQVMCKLQAMGNLHVGTPYSVLCTTYVASEAANKPS